MSTMTTNPISSTDDVIDSRDVIERIEQLQAIREPGPVAEGVLNPEDYDADQDSLFAELAALEALAAEGDTIADWQYGATLIHENHFTDYAKELAEDLGTIPRDYSWPTSHIDWEAAANALKMDYSIVEFGGETYYVRS